MLAIRRSGDRGRSSHGWLESAHTFSFAAYHDPAFMGVGALRVLNEDRVAPGSGFGAHAHRDMEILSCVIDGALEHRDSMGNGSVIRPGELQLMRAGTGVTHSEYNHSQTEPVHFLQIWIVPEERGLEPAYEQRAFPEADRRGRLCRVASRDGADGSLRIRQDVSVYATLLEPGESVRHVLAPMRRAWLQVVAGDLDVNGARTAAGDGVLASGESELVLRAAASAEALLFELA